jgi:hypothetical protein
MAATPEPATAASQDLWAKTTKGFTAYADAVLEDGSLRADEQQFLAREFDGARERMTNLASTVGTAGSFVLVLVALLVSFANGVRDESDKQTAAAQSEALLNAGCGEKSDTERCLPRRAAQAGANKDDAKKRVDHLNALNKTQAIIGVCVLLGFVLGLAGVVINPVRGPDAVADSEGKAHEATVEGWKAAVGRLKRKRNCIGAALLVQGAGMVAIVVLAFQVASDA